MPQRLRYNLRPADLSDLQHCVEIDAGYITNQVWQMDERLDDINDLLEDPHPPSAAPGRPRIVGKEQVSPPGSKVFRISFQPSRLPRPVAVPSPYNEQQLLAEWKRTDFLMIAELVEGGENGAPLKVGPLIGYIGVTVDGSRHIAWITSGAVAGQYRRNGVGSRLITEARKWADSYRLRALMLELQTKNLPAIECCQQNGFFFCGYNSLHSPNREISLFFALRLDR